MANILIHKVFVIVSLNFITVSYGFAYGHTSSMIRALQKHDDGIELSDAEISLIAGLLLFTAITSYILLGAIGDKLGRRRSFIIFSIPLVVNWIILLYAREFVAFIISRLLAGASVGPLTVLSFIATPEYTSPKSRALFMSITLMVTPALGTGLGHVLGVLLHWRTLVKVGLFISIVHVILPYFWVESPHWLASKGQFESCERSFRRLHGNKPSSEEELRLIIKMESSKQIAGKEMNANHGFQNFLSMLKKRYFWNLMIMNTFVHVYYAAAGKVVFSHLATVVLEEMTGTADVLLYTLLVDGFILVGTCVSCVLIKRMSIRSLLFSSGLTAIGILLVLSACLYFKNGEGYFQWINVILLAFYFIITHAGPYPIMDILLGEMFPMEHKIYSFALTSPIVIATLFSSLMLLPTLISVLGYHGLFLLNSAIMFICLWYLWTRLPETKGKTLQEIEVYFKTNNFDVDEVLRNEQIKTLI